MALVSLIVPVGAVGPPPTVELEAARQALEQAGHEVELLIAAEAGVSAPESGIGSSEGWIAVQDAGRAAAGVAGVERARGMVRMVLDPAMGYEPADLVRVVEALETGQADLAIASRWTSNGRLRGGVGWILRRLVGTSDPLSGLIGVTREALDRAEPNFTAVGSQFSFELLGRVPGRRVDVPVRPGLTTWRGGRPGFDDLRHLKRLADHRYGNFSRLLQFCAVGASGMVVDLSCYAAFQWLFAQTRLNGQTAPLIGPLDLAAAGALAIAIALCWNFSLNRRLTFSYARHGSLVRQFVTYVLSNALAVSLNLSIRLALPRSIGFFSQHKLAAALVGIVMATAISFSMSRWVVFRHRHEPRVRDARAEPVLAESSSTH